MQHHHALLQIVVDLRCVALDLLLQLVKVLLRADLFEQENKPGDDAKDPEQDLKNEGAHAHLDRELFDDHVRVNAFFSYLGVQFV